MRYDQLLARPHLQEERIMKDQVGAILLAAGKGTRMKSQKPKILHQIWETPIIERVIKATLATGTTELCLVLSQIHPELHHLLHQHPEIRVCLQPHQGGTGEAVAAASAAFDLEQPASSTGSLVHGSPLTTRHVIILCGDTPALNNDTLNQFMKHCHENNAELAVLATDHQNPKGYGRIIRNRAGNVTAIIEERDADPKTRMIKTCNTGIFFAETKLLFHLVSQLNTNNSQGEYYLTDCFAAAIQQGVKPIVYVAENPTQFTGINNRQQLADLEAQMIAQKRLELMTEGVTFHLPSTIYVSEEATIGQDTEIWPGAVICGKTRIGKECHIGANAVLRDCLISDGSTIESGITLANTSI